MEGLSIRGRQIGRTAPKSRGMGRAVRLSFGAATLVASMASVAGIAQTSGGVPGWSNAQFQGSPGGDPERGERVVESKCMACHGADGNSRDLQFPKLAAQNPAYLYRQLWAFKEGTRKSDVMSGIAATLSDAEMADAASFYSQQRRKPDAVKDMHLAAIGERVFFSGMPSCAMCHGSSGQRGMMGRMPMMGMMGMMGRGMMGSGTADVPNLNGQHATYMFDQLDKFTSGERQGTIMNRIAPALSEANKKAVAEYLSGAP